MTEEEITAAVERLIVELMPELEGNISPTASFEELGMDSLNRVDLLASAEAAFGVEVPDEEVANFRKVDDVVRFVAASVSSGRVG